MIQGSTVLTQSRALHQLWTIAKHDRRISKDLDSNINILMMVQQLHPDTGVLDSATPLSVYAMLLTGLIKVYIGRIRHIQNDFSSLLSAISHSKTSQLPITKRKRSATKITAAPTDTEGLFESDFAFWDVSALSSADSNIQDIIRSLADTPEIFRDESPAFMTPVMSAYELGVTESPLDLGDLPDLDLASLGDHPEADLYTLPSFLPQLDFKTEAIQSTSDKKARIRSRAGIPRSAEKRTQLHLPKEVRAIIRKIPPCSVRPFGLIGHLQLRLQRHLEPMERMRAEAIIADRSSSVTHDVFIDKLPSQSGSVAPLEALSMSSVTPLESTVGIGSLDLPELPDVAFGDSIVLAPNNIPEFERTIQMDSSEIPTSDSSAILKALNSYQVAISFDRELVPDISRVTGLSARRVATIAFTALLREPHRICRADNGSMTINPRLLT